MLKTGVREARSIGKNTTMLKAQEPYRLDAARSNSPRVPAVIEVTNSGNAVANPSKAVPMKDSPKPVLSARFFADSANLGAAKKIRIAPTLNSTIARPRVPPFDCAEGG